MPVPHNWARRARQTPRAQTVGVRRGSLTLLSLSYLLVATLSRVGNLDKLVSLPWATGHIAAGCLGGLLVAFVGTAVRRRHEPDQVRAARAPMPIRPILASLRSFDERARDGVRRAVPLAILMFFFQLNGGRDAFWAFFAAYLVLLAPGKTPRSLAAAAWAAPCSGCSCWPSPRSSCPTRCCSRWA